MLMVVPRVVQHNPVHAKTFSYSCITELLCLLSVFISTRTRQLDVHVQYLYTHVGLHQIQVCYTTGPQPTDLTLRLCLGMQSQLHGVLPVVRGQFGQLQQTAVRWNNRLKQACAVCHSLTVENRTVAGDAVEELLFQMVEATFQVSTHL